MTWGKSLLLLIPLSLSGIFVVSAPASSLVQYSNTDWISVSTGAEHSCAVRNGSAYCWGSDASGQVGTGGGLDGVVSSPDRVDNTGWTAVSAGGAHTCGVRNGRLYCWGSDASGQLGNGANSTGPQDSPVQVYGSFTNWKSVSAGTSHTCAIRGAGTLYCWGNGGSGQVGNGTTGSPTIPVRVSSVYDWKSVAAGDAHTCALRGTGTLYCWGNDGSGQLGNGSGGSSTLPVRITSLSNWTSVAAGDTHTCALRGAGTLYCWGSDEFGQLGNGTAGNRTSPVSITSHYDWKQVNAGASHTCAFRGTGIPYCWGDNTYGQVDDVGTTPTYSSPVPRYSPSANWKAIDGGGRHTCGLRGAGILYCWGGNVTYPTPGSANPAGVPGFEGLSYWKLTVPVDSGGGTGGTAVEIKQPDLATFKNPAFFHASSDNQKVYFRARVDGATTAGSQYPRSELRETKSNGTTNAAWSNATGTHTMTIRQAITHLPDAKPQVVAGQIHDGTDDVMQIRLESSRLFVVIMDGNTKVADQTLTSSYQLGTMFDVRIRADASGITVTYNGSAKPTVRRIASSATWYFKAGCYTQSNDSVQGELPEAYGEVLIDSVSVTPVTN